MPHPWASSSCVIALLTALVLVWQAHAQAQMEDQETMAIGIEHSLMYQSVTDDLIVMGEYPKATYGSFATPLTIINRELMNFQQRKLDQEMKQKAMGSLNIGDSEIFVDARMRADALKKVAMLKELNSQNMQNRHDFRDAVRSDIESSDMSAAFKRDFLDSFDKHAQQFIDQGDSYCKLALEIDGLYEDMLDVAAADKPRLVKGHFVFNTEIDFKRFQDDVAKLELDAKNLRNMRATVVQTVQDAMPYLKDRK
jgi:hypothetical protein